MCERHKNSLRTRVNDWQTCLGNCQPIKHVLYSCDLSDTSQNGECRSRWTRSHGHFVKFIDEVHKCLAVWDVSSVVYKDIKKKQTKREQLGDKVSFVQKDFSISQPLSISSLFFFCFTVVRECYCIKSAVLQITMCCNLTLVWRVKEWVCQLFEVWQCEFTNLSLPWEGRFSDPTYKGDMKSRICHVKSSSGTWKAPCASFLVLTAPSYSR